MTAPLALLFYENLLPGSQLINRLQDLGYRVQATGDANALISQAVSEKPLVVMADLASTRNDVCAMIRELKSRSDTKHIPVIAFTGIKNEQLHLDARSAGATLVAGDDALLQQLPQLLQQALEVE